MKVVSIVLIGLALSCGSARAQLNEAQKRKLLLPSIKNATDCIAREAARHANIVFGYRYGDLSPMINDGWKACTNQLAEIVVKHDNLHGTGTGLPFVKGAYSEDLPRAVRARLKSDLDGRIAAQDRAEAEAKSEQARLEAERQQNTDRLERSAIALRDRIYDCTGPQLGKLVSSAEAADVLATAAMTICRQEIDDAIEGRLAVMRVKFGSNYIWANEPTNRESFKKSVRESVITTAVQLKASGSLPPPAAPKSTVPASVEPQASSSPTVGASLPKELRDCLSKIASARNGQFIDQKKLYEGMLELCRPEIEAAARTAFLTNKDSDLAKEREKALTEASIAAKAMIGML